MSDIETILLVRQKDGCVHISSDLGRALSQVRPRSPRFAKLIIQVSAVQSHLFDIWGA